jgi:hypothetical protein
MCAVCLIRLIYTETGWFCSQCGAMGWLKKMMRRVRRGSLLREKGL